MRKKTTLLPRSIPAISEIHLTIGKQLAKLFRTGKSVAKAASLAPATASRLLAGIYDMRLSLLIQLSKLVGIPPHQLINPKNYGAVQQHGSFLLARSYPVTLWVRENRLITETYPDRLVARKVQGVWVVTNLQRPLPGPAYELASFEMLSDCPLPTPGLHIHVITGHQTWRDQTVAFLRAAGYQVTWHESVDEALPQLRDFSAVIVDGAPDSDDELAISWIARIRTASQCWSAVLFTAPQHTAYGSGPVPYLMANTYLVTRKHKDVENTLRILLSNHISHDHETEPDPDPYKPIERAEY